MDSIVKIPIDQLYPHPDNPRKDLGDLSELAESIRAKGIMQNLTVVRGRRGTDEELEQIAKLYDSLSDDNDLERGAREEIREQLENRWVVTDYTIVIGHRRHAAAKLAGLTELPCVIVDMDPREQMQTMLIENMQRSDLTKFEEAHGFQMMLDLGTPVEEIAEKTGFSETTVRRRLKWMELDQAKFKKVTEERQISLGDLDSLSQIEDLKLRNECLDKIGTSEFDMTVQKAIKQQKTEENMPKVKAWLKSVKAKKIKESDRYSSSYDRIGGTIYINNWGEPGCLPPKDIEKEPVFYWIGSTSWDFNQLALYRERKKAPPVKRSQEEIDRDKAIKAAWDQLDSLAENALALRKKFIDEFSVSNKTRNDVLRGAIVAACHEAVNYNSPDRTTLYKMAGIEETGYISDRDERFWKGFEKIPPEDWAKLVYAIFGDAPIHGANGGYRKEFPKYSLNIKLNLIYAWLVSIGYEMSTEEMDLLNGSHAAYKAGDPDGEM
jgi:ParB family chromosome partitioning protein